MSRTYFHSEEDTVELQGPERHYAAGLVNDLALGLLGLSLAGWHREEILKFIPPDDYMHKVKPEQFNNSFRAWWSAGFGERHLLVDGERWEPFDLSLNTAIVAGSDPVEFMARMHATCEIHGYVEGEDREFVAGIIEEGRATGIMRAEMGWEEVVVFLRSSDKGPVVMSYSVTDSFPNAHTSDWLPPWPEGVPKQWDALSEEQQAELRELNHSWYDLSDDEQWERGMKFLRDPNLSGGVSIDPDMWSSRLYGPEPCPSVFDLRARMHASG